MLGQNINEIYRAGLDVRAGAATPADSSSQGWSVTTLSGTYERLFNYRTDVKISAGLSGVTDSEHDFKYYFSPRAEIKHTFRSEEHTSELQSRGHLVCRLLLEKKK